MLQAFLSCFRQASRGRLGIAIHGRLDHRLALIDGKIQEFLLHCNKSIHAAVDHFGKGGCLPCHAQSVFNSLENDAVLLYGQIQQDFLRCNKVGGALRGELHQPAGRAR